MANEEELYPKNNKEYANKSYWDWRYTKYSSFQVFSLMVSSSRRFLGFLDLGLAYFLPMNWIKYFQK